MTLKRVLSLFSLLLFSLFYPNAVQAQIPAFPGAEGFGADTPGGRGGQVYEVTNLNDSGSGSFRACAEGSGPRICVFRVAGTITMNSHIDILNPYVTIAGQTAPGGGITLKSADPNSTVHFRVRTHDVILRYIRSRPGTFMPDGRALSVGKKDPSPYNVIVDHVSLSWAGDELYVNWYDTNTITLQWSIVAESLPNFVHGFPGYKGPNLGSGGVSGHLTLHHNLLAHHTQRYPVTSTGSRPIDIINNIMYNLGGYGYIHLRYETKANLINNYVKGGPNGTINIAVKDGLTEGGGFYHSGNYIEPGWSVKSFAPDTHRVDTPYNTIPINIQTPQQAYQDILDDAGASAGLDCNGNWFERRDTVDLRIIDSVRKGTRGHNLDPANTVKELGFISDPSDVGGWPSIYPGTPCTDSDHDGMPNDWENLYSFNPNSSSDGNQDADNDGYTNIEEYLNGTNPRNGEPMPSITNTPTPTVSKPGDANGDDKVDVADYVIWLSNFNQAKRGSQYGDFNNSGKVDGEDFIIWLTNY